MTEGSWSDLIAEAHEVADAHRPDVERAIMRRIIEGRGRTSGKMYGYAAKNEPETHLVAFKREVAR